MGFNVRSWTPEEDAILLERIETEARVQVARSFPGRTPHSVRSRIAILTQSNDTSVWHEARMENASKKLAAAIHALIERMDPQEVEAHGIELGEKEERQGIPGTERIYRGQMAQRKLAA